MAEPILYILARQDIPQMNAGKLGAQCAHAQSVLSEHISHLRLIDAHRRKDDINVITEDKHNRLLLDDYHEWQRGRAFGVTITLAVTKEEMDDLEDSMAGRNLGRIVDPTYPMVSETGYAFTEERETCAYLFAGSRDSHVRKYMQKFNLYP
jgi:hypothetical protein